MLRRVLKSKIHHAVVTEVRPDSEGGIEIPTDLVEASGLCDGEVVLVASIASGLRLETHVQAGPARSGRIIVHGAAARQFTRGEHVTIMAFGLSHEPVLPQKLVLNERNEIVSQGS